MKPATAATAMAQSNESEKLHFVPLDLSKCHDQHDSPLFTIVPPEIRNRIFEFALSNYEDSSAAYAADTCYRRPGYTAPHKTSTALLQTCQLVYREAWFRPWTQALITMFLTSRDRKPERTTSMQELMRNLELIHAVHGRTEVDHVRVFAQLYALETGRDLSRILSLPHFFPTTFTITLRHTDWWYWESDNPMYIDSPFVNNCSFPPSLKELRMELESLERRKAQVDFIANEMRQKWCFKRSDGVKLSARGSEIETMKWTGSSTFNGDRWIRDEARPDELDYHVATVVFRPEKPITPLSTEQQIRDAFSDAHHSPKLQVKNVSRINTGVARIPSRGLRDANVPHGTAGDEALRLISEHQAEVARRQREQREAARRERDGMADGIFPGGGCGTPSDDGTGYDWDAVANGEPVDDEDEDGDEDEDDDDHEDDDDDQEDDDDGEYEDDDHGHDDEFSVLMAGLP